MGCESGASPLKRCKPSVPPRAYRRDCPANGRLLADARERGGTRVGTGLAAVHARAECTRVAGQEPDDLTQYFLVRMTSVNTSKRYTWRHSQRSADILREEIKS